MLHRSIAALACVAVFAVFPVSRADAQSSTQRIVLKIDGLTTGLNSSASKTADKDWLPVVALSFDAVSPAAGGGAGAAVGGVPAIDRLILRKNSDVSSAAFLERWMTSAALPSVEIEYRKTIGSTEVVAIKYRLTNAVIFASRFALDQDAVSPALDQIEFGFSQLEMTSNEIDSKGKVVNSRVVVFDATSGAH